MILQRKKTNGDVEKPITPSATNQKIPKVSIISSITMMFTEPSVYIPILINQSGSFVFYFILLHEPISVAGPVCNSLTFIFTAITGYFVFKEEIHSPLLLIIGIIFVLFGIYICITNE